METVQKIEQSLNLNGTINPAIKDRLMRLTLTFHKNFPNISLDNLSERLESVRFIQGSKYFYDDAIQYVSRDNQVVINSEKLKSPEVDANYAMMKTLLSIITAKESSFGFGDNRNLEALNVGFCEIVANNLVGNEGESDYLDEQIIVNSIGQAVGVDEFLNSFFTNNPDALVKKLLSVCGDVRSLNSFLSQANHNMHTRKQTGISHLYDLQKQVINLFGNGYNFLMIKKAMETATMKYPGQEILEQVHSKDRVKK